jgi:hypothetical protein
MLFVIITAAAGGCARDRPAAPLHFRHLTPRIPASLPCRLSPLHGKLILSVRDQTSLSSPGNEAILELRRSFSFGANRLSELLLKYSPRLDRDGRDKVELTASAAVLAAEDLVLSAEATIKSPDNVFDAKGSVKTKGYLMSVEHNSRDSSPLSRLDIAKPIAVYGKNVRLNAGLRLSPEPTVLGRADIAFSKRFKLSPHLICRTSSWRPSLVKLEASGVAKDEGFGWKMDITPAHNEASIEVRELVEHGVWFAKATVPTDGSVGATSLAIRREIIW